jgi:hypothetical protein
MGLPTTDEWIQRNAHVKLQKDRCRTGTPRLRIKGGLKICRVTDMIATDRTWEMQSLELETFSFLSFQSS